KDLAVGGILHSSSPLILWRLVNSAGIRSVPGGEGAGPGPGPGPDSFQATRFGSFVRQLNLYGFHKVPGDAGGWLHFRNANFVRDRPELLLRIQRLTRANRQRLAAGLEVRSRQPSRFQQLHTERPLPGSVVVRPSGREIPGPLGWKGRDLAVGFLAVASCQGMEAGQFSKTVEPTGES
uniref:HSF-type DNA-binding domain-containing protein n=1 Tax=Ficedula albicollis TaxID=59894 RepID=A0A803W7U8_FICAL